MSRASTFHFEFPMLRWTATQDGKQQTLQQATCFS